MKWFDIKFWKWALLVLLIGIVAVGFVSCKSKEYVTVPEYHTEYICKTDTFAKLDSVYLKDSVFVYHNGDTVIINKIAYRDRYHNIYKVKTDTVLKKDSIPYPVYVEKELGKVDCMFLRFGKVSLIVLIGAIFMLIIIPYVRAKIKE